MKAVETVRKIFENKAKSGRCSNYAITTESGTKYKHLFNKPKFNEGDTISFEYEEDEYNGNVSLVMDQKTVKVETASAPKSSGGGSAKSSGGGSFGSNQECIAMQAARNSAIAFFQLAQSSGALTLPKTKGAALDTLMDLVDAEVARYYLVATDAKARSAFVEGVGGEVVVEAEKLEDASQDFSDDDE